MFERVMTLNYFRINCIIEKLYSSCYWFSNIFSLYNLFEIWSFIFNYKTFIASKNWHNYLNQLFCQKKCIYKTCLMLNTSWYLMQNCSNQSYRRKNAFVVLLIFKYVFVVRFYFLIFFYQCRCSVINAKVLNVCF